MDAADVSFSDDPYGEWRPLLRACVETRPAAVIVGDRDPAIRPCQHVMPLIKAVVLVWRAAGNHDNESAGWHDRLWGDCPEANLHANRASLEGVTVAGLGGIFKGSIWFPRVAYAVPDYPDRHAYVRQAKAFERWRGGLPLSVKAAVFPDDAQTLCNAREDILVTHEAPTGHRHGFVGIDAVAAVCGARLVVHGHQRDSYDGRLPGDARVKKLAKAEVVRITREMLE